MQHESGVITVVQEGRFRLSSDDGRSLLFTLDHRAALEPQDLPELLTQRVDVGYTEASGRRSLVARRVSPAEAP